tara:strand:+ start:772 stop:909 length:138 start_codon:yes stop_codon:yes gene_type:complete
MPEPEAGAIMIRKIVPGDAKKDSPKQLQSKSPEKSRPPSESSEPV